MATGNDPRRIPPGKKRRVTTHMWEEVYSWRGTEEWVPKLDPKGECRRQWGRTNFILGGVSTFMTFR